MPRGLGGRAALRCNSSHSRDAVLNDLGVLVVLASVQKATWCGPVLGEEAPLW